MNTRLFLFTAILTVFTGAFVWVRLQMVNISFEIHDLEGHVKVLKDETNRLQLKVDEARSPYRLERLAAQKFKMHVPSADQLVVLKVTD